MSEKITYIFIFDVANCVTGGLIYPRNKIRYLKNIGVDVKVIPTNSGKIYIDGLEEYQSSDFSFMHELPFIFNKTQLRKCLLKVCDYIGECENTIFIETGTDCTSFWGELVAQELNATHITVFLDEDNQRLKEFSKEYWQFKYDRGELICISDEAMHHNFGKLISIHSGERSFHCYCGNSIENTGTGVIIDDFLSEINIGYFGRTDKKVLEKIIDSVNAFFEKSTDKTLTFFVFGGPIEYENVIRKMLNQNIRLYVSGFIFPLQLNTAKKMNVFISTAGSASALGNCGICTIRMDMYNFTPVGVITDVDSSSYAYCPNGDKLEDYLDWILIKNTEIKIIAHSLDEQWEKYCTEYSHQIDYVRNLYSRREYYPTNLLRNNFKTIMKRIIVSMFGYKIYKTVYKKAKRMR